MPGHNPPLAGGLDRAWRMARTDPWPAPGALCLLAVVSYLPAVLWGNFIWDDLPMIGTLAVRDPGGLRQIWFSPAEIEAEGHYWPLVYSLFWLQHKLWGFAPAGFHAVNVLLHTANTLLLWQLMRRLAVPGACVVAAVFAVHPVHVESVAWVIELKDVLSGLFYLSALLAWIRFDGEPRAGRYLMALALYAAGMLAKSVVVTLPAALLIWHWWRRGRVTVTDLVRTAPFFAVGALISVADLIFNRSQGVGGLGYSLIERGLIAARAVWFYVGKLLWPVDLGLIYPHWEVRAADPLGWAALAAAVAVVTMLWLLRRRIGRGPLAGVLFFGITLSPTLGFVDYNFMLFSFVADRYQYLASIGVIAVIIGAAGHGVAAAFRAGRLWTTAASAVLAVALLGVLGTLTWRQATLYHDGITFFNHVIAHHPRAREAHLNLGSALLRWNRLEEALAAYRVAEEHRPEDCKPPYGAGIALYHLSRPDEAEEAYLRALELCPGYAPVLADLSTLRLDQQRHEDALELSRTATDLDPHNATAWTNRGIALSRLGREEEALESLDRALALDAHQQQAQDARARILQESTGP